MLEWGSDGSVVKTGQAGERNAARNAAITYLHDNWPSLPEDTSLDRLLTLAT